MSDRSNIEWTDSTWNPVTGCTEVSPGCDHCYAKTLAERFRDVPGHYYERGFDVQLRPAKLDQPLRWRRPRLVFVNSMSDLFHDSVPDEYIANVFAVMALTKQHTFQLLTKRHSRMRSLLNGDLYDLMIRHLENNSDLPWAGEKITWPLPNLWLGVSVENQRWADIRIPALLGTHATVRFLSCEPLLGPVSLFANTRIDTGTLVDWVIVGGESGRDARPMHPLWARGLRQECLEHGIPFHFKQWGEWVEDEHARDLIGDDGVAGMRNAAKSTVLGNLIMRRVGKKAAGRELDGRTWDDFPKPGAGSP